MDKHHFYADPDSTYHYDADPDYGFLIDADSDYDFIWCGFGSELLLDADPDPTFHPDVDPDPDPNFQIKAQTLAKGAQIGSYSIHFGLEDPDPA